MDGLKARITRMGILSAVQSDQHHSHGCRLSSLLLAVITVPPILVTLELVLKALDRPRIKKSLLTLSGTMHQQMASSGFVIQRCDKWKKARTKEKVV